MKRYCSICNSIHSGKCSPRHYPERRRNSEADRFRNTRRWRSKAEHIRSRDCNCCRVCLEAGLIEYRELSVHHIIPLVQDFTRRLDDENLITLCRFHHEKAEKNLISKRKLLEIVQKPVILPKL